MCLAIRPGKSKTQDEIFVEQNSIIAQRFNKYETKINTLFGLYKKWQALVGNLAKTLPVAEGTKLTCVGDYK